MDGVEPGLVRWFRCRTNILRIAAFRLGFPLFDPIWKESSRGKIAVGTFVVDSTQAHLLQVAPRIFDWNCGERAVLSVDVPSSSVAASTAKTMRVMILAPS